MWKSVAVATAAIVIAGSSIVVAQQRFGEPDGYRDGARFEHRRLSPEDRAAFVDARIAALKAGLELTPDQAKNWPAFEQALRDMAKLRAERIAAREAREQNPSQTPVAPFDRLAQHADNMAKASAALKHIAETGQPLYTSLDDAQKARFQRLARLLRPHRMHARFEERGPGWRDGEGDRFWEFRHHQFGQDDGAQGGLHRLSEDEGSQL
jgi:zinc resistance-associated protein